jgi:hypothetical protein
MSYAGSSHHLSMQVLCTESAEVISDGNESVSECLHPSCGRTFKTSIRVLTRSKAELRSIWNNELPKIRQEKPMWAI